MAIICPYCATQNPDGARVCFNPSCARPLEGNPTPPAGAPVAPVPSGTPAGGFPPFTPGPVSTKPKWLVPAIIGGALALVAAVALTVVVVKGRGGGDASPATTVNDSKTATTSAGPSTTAGAQNTTSTTVSNLSPLDQTLGRGATAMQAAMAAATAKPLAAVGEPIVIGYEGTSVGDAPTSWLGAFTKVADVINQRFGGLGGDPVTGRAGRPIKIVGCSPGDTPAAADACTDSLIAQKPYAVVQGLNLDAARSITKLRAAGITANLDMVFYYPGYDAIPLLYVNPLSCPSLGAGLVDIAINTYKATSVAVPYQPLDGCYVNSINEYRAAKGQLAGVDTTPTVDGFGAALQVAKGRGVNVTAVPIDVRNVYPDWGTPDQVAQYPTVIGQAADAVLASGATAILLNYDGKVCADLVNALLARGWDPNTMHLITTDCGDPTKLPAAVVFDLVARPFGAASPVPADPAIAAELALINQITPGAYVGPGQVLFTLWQQYGELVAGTAGPPGAPLPANPNPTGDAFLASLQTAGRHHYFAAAAQECGKIKGYPSLCLSLVQPLHWQGGRFAGGELVDSAEKIFGRAG